MGTFMPINGNLHDIKMHLTFFYTILCEISDKTKLDTHGTDKAVRVPLLAQCRDELFADWMSAASASRSKQLVIVVSAAFKLSHRRLNIRKQPQTIMIIMQQMSL